MERKLDVLSFFCKISTMSIDSNAEVVGHAESSIDSDTLEEALMVLADQRILLKEVICKAGPSVADVDLMTSFFAKRGEDCPFPEVLKLSREGGLH